MDTVKSILSKLNGYIYTNTEIFIWIVVALVLLVLLLLLWYSASFRREFAIIVILAAGIIWLLTQSDLINLQSMRSGGSALNVDRGAVYASPAPVGRNSAWPQVAAKQAFVGCPTNTCLESFVLAEFYPKTGKATFGNSA